MALIALTSCSDEASVKTIDFNAPKWLQGTWYEDSSDGTYVNTYKITSDKLIGTEWNSSTNSYATMDFFGVLDSSTGDYLSYQNTTSTDSSHIISLRWSDGGTVIETMTISFALNSNSTLSVIGSTWIYGEGTSTNSAKWHR